MANYRLGALGESEDPASATLPKVKEVAGQPSSPPPPITKGAEFRSPPIKNEAEFRSSPIKKEADFRSPPAATQKEVEQKSPAAAVKVEAEQRLPPPPAIKIDKKGNSPPPPPTKEEAEQQSPPVVSGATGKQRPQREKDGGKMEGTLTLPALRAYLTASSTPASPGTLQVKMYRTCISFHGTVTRYRFLNIPSCLVCRFRISNLFVLGRIFAEIGAYLGLSSHYRNDLIFI